MSNGRARKAKGTEPANQDCDERRLELEFLEHIGLGEFDEFR
jgi:hypothetical protein